MFHIIITISSDYITNHHELFVFYNRDALFSCDIGTKVLNNIEE